MSLQHRCRQPEIMDQPGLSSERHRGALRGLARINFWSGSARILWPGLRDLAREVAPRPLRVLDLATGGGDVPLRLWRWARRANVPLLLEGCDVSPVAIEHARAAALGAGADVRFFVHDALHGPPLSGYDAVTCSLFLRPPRRRRGLRTVATDAGDDGPAGANQRPEPNSDGIPARPHGYANSHALRCGPHGRAAFGQGGVHSEEARQLAERAGLPGAVVGRRWPCRWLLTWRRP